MNDTWYADDTATFGDRVTAAREASGLSVTDLARRLGVRDSTVEAWEHDQADPRANRLQMVAGILNVSLMWLLSGEGPGIAPPEEGEAPSGTDHRLDELRAEVRAVRTELRQMSERLSRLDRALARAWAGH